MSTKIPIKKDIQSIDMLRALYVAGIPTGMVTGGILGFAYGDPPLIDCIGGMGFGGLLGMFWPIIVPGAIIREIVK